MGIRPAQVPYPGIIRDQLEPPLERVQMVRRHRSEHHGSPRAEQRMPGDLVRLGRDHDRH